MYPCFLPGPGTFDSLPFWSCSRDHFSSFADCSVGSRAAGAIQLRWDHCWTQWLWTGGRTTFMWLPFSLTQIWYDDAVLRLWCASDLTMRLILGSNVCVFPRRHLVGNRQSRPLTVHHPYCHAGKGVHCAVWWQGMRAFSFLCFDNDMAGAQCRVVARRDASRCRDWRWQRHPSHKQQCARDRVQSQHGCTHLVCLSFFADPLSSCMDAHSAVTGTLPMLPSSEIFRKWDFWTHPTIMQLLWKHPQSWIVVGYVSSNFWLLLTLDYAGLSSRLFSRWEFACRGRWWWSHVRFWHDQWQVGTSIP